MSSPVKSKQLEAAQRGDRQALESLLSEQESRIYRFGMKMCGHEQDAEDILQETMLAASRTIGNFQGNSSISTWLYTIARSFCIKKRRQSKFAPSRLESLESASRETERIAHPGASPDDAVQSREIEHALETALAQLEPEHREVLLLRDMEGLKASEVAEVLEMTVVAVKSRLHRARARLRDALIPVLQDPPVRRASSCPDVLAIYSQQLEGELSAEICARMERHLELCTACRATCASLKQILASCSSYPKTVVPASVQAQVRAALKGS